MADALVSPQVGAAMFAVSAGLLLYGARRTRKTFRSDRMALMGVTGAFIFAAQMVNFAIPGTGSSGHIGGAVLLAALLGACPAFLVLSCVLIIQALFFADGGLLALGCNIFNLGFFGCFIAYPLIFRPIAGNMQSSSRIMVASILACVAALQLGAFSVVLETLISGVTQLPFSTFALLMQPIHLAIGAIEGILTGLAILFIRSARPELFQIPKPGLSLLALVCALTLATAAIGGGISLLASDNPDGLEWSIEKTVANSEIANETPTHAAASRIQEATALLPDYTLPGHTENTGTAVSGILGSLLTFGAIVLAMIVLRHKQKHAA